jgi:hypothetical protein
MADRFPNAISKIWTFERVSNISSDKTCFITTVKTLAIEPHAVEGNSACCRVNRIS